MCERRAANFGKELTPQFWDDKNWRGYYMYQLRLAHALVKKYPPQHVLKGVQSVSWAYSLKTAKVREAIEKVIAETPTYVEEQEEHKIVTESRGRFHRPNKLGKLDG